MSFKDNSGRQLLEQLRNGVISRRKFAQTAAARSETDPDVLIEKFIEMNDMIGQENVLVPVVVVGGGSAGSNRLNKKNLISGSFAGAYANIANWRTADAQ